MEKNNYESPSVKVAEVEAEKWRMFGVSILLSAIKGINAAIIREKGSKVCSKQMLLENSHNLRLHI